MLEQDRQFALQALKNGHNALRAALSGVDDALAARRPEPESWSIVECVEHVAAAEGSLLSRLNDASPADHSTENRAREAAILSRGADRSRPAKSPEAALPRGRLSSLKDSLAAFESARTETILFTERFDGDPRCRLTDHPLIPGPVNVYEMLLIMSVHPLRHAEQIKAIRGRLTP